MERPRPSSVAWGVLAAGVAAYDILSPQGETLSERVDDWLEKPITRSLAIGAIGVTALHLANALPPKYDPFHRLTMLKNTAE